MSLDDVAVPTLDGAPTTLREHEGQVLLAVDVASRCGSTPQYAGLEALHAGHRDQGFTVLGFPCDQFLFQEPGGSDAITACGVGYGVTFPGTVLRRYRSRTTPEQIEADVVAALEGRALPAA